MVLLTGVSSWAKNHRSELEEIQRQARYGQAARHFEREGSSASIAILMALLFSKFVYLASLTSYYTFYLINKFHMTR